MLLTIFWIGVDALIWLDILRGRGYKSFLGLAFVTSMLLTESIAGFTAMHLSGVTFVLLMLGSAKFAAFKLGGVKINYALAGINLITTPPSSEDVLKRLDEEDRKADKMLREAEKEI